MWRTGTHSHTSETHTARAVRPLECAINKHSDLPQTLDKSRKKSLSPCTARPGGAARRLTAVGMHARMLSLSISLTKLHPMEIMVIEIALRSSLCGTEVSSGATRLERTKYKITSKLIHPNFRVHGRERDYRGGPCAFNPPPRRSPQARHPELNKKTPIGSLPHQA